jgi:hypothetical protein
LIVGIDLPMSRLYLSSSDLRSREGKQRSSSKTFLEPTLRPVEDAAVHCDAERGQTGASQRTDYFTAQYLDHTASTGKHADKLKRIWIEIFARRDCGKPRIPSANLGPLPLARYRGQ